MGAEELNSYEEIEILNKQATQIKTGITELFPLVMEDGCVLFSIGSVVRHFLGRSKETFIHLQVERAPTDLRQDSILIQIDEPKSLSELFNSHTGFFKVTTL